MARVYWITGLSGAGKTTIGKKFYNYLKSQNDALVFLDGDELRQVFGDDLGYTEADRKKCAMRYSRICKMLSDQQITVVICTISMYHEIREWNRENIKGYYEIYLHVSRDVLNQRNQKNLYAEALAGLRTDVVGAIEDFEEPKNPDLVLENDGSISPDDMVKQICGELAL